jgi:hypothetical protein
MSTSASARRAAYDAQTRDQTEKGKGLDKLNVGKGERDKLLGDRANLQSQVACLQTRVATLENDNATLQTRVAALLTRVATTEEDNATLETRLATVEEEKASFHARLQNMEDVLSPLSIEGTAGQKDVILNLLKAAAGCSEVGARLASMERVLEGGGVQVACQLVEKLGLHSEDDCRQTAATLNKLSDDYIGREAELRRQDDALRELQQQMDTLREQHAASTAAAAAAAAKAAAAADAVARGAAAGPAAGTPHGRQALPSGLATRSTSHRFCAISEHPADVVHDALVGYLGCNRGAVTVVRQQSQRQQPGPPPGAQQQSAAAASGPAAQGPRAQPLAWPSSPRDAAAMAAADGQQGGAADHPAAPQDRTRYVVTVPSQDLADQIVCQGRARDALRVLGVAIDDYLTPQEVRERNRLRPEMARLQAQGRKVAFRRTQLWEFHSNPQGLKDRRGSVWGTWKPVEGGGGEGDGGAGTGRPRSGGEGRRPRSQSRRGGRSRSRPRRGGGSPARPAGEAGMGGAAGSSRQGAGAAAAGSCEITPATQQP